MGDHTSIVQEEPQDLRCSTKILGHLCRGRRIQICGHSDLGSFNGVTDTASAACPLQSGSLAMTSVTFAAAI